MFMKFKNRPNITVTGLVQGKIYDKPCLFPSNNIEVSCIFFTKKKKQASDAFWAPLVMFP